MDIIPVIDILRGQVVRAVRGNRQAYLPIISLLCHNADPVLVASTLCAHCEAKRLYVADLDALQGGAVQTPILQALLKALPDVEIWLDAGFTGRRTVCDLLNQLVGRERVVPVYGSESLQDKDVLDTRENPYSLASGQAVLSLDRSGGQAMGQAMWWDQTELWPNRVIVMTLDRVGANEGPDLALVAQIRQRAPHVSVIGAGGVRHAEDLASAQAAGAHAWLVASALHDGRLRWSNVG